GRYPDPGTGSGGAAGARALARHGGASMKKLLLICAALFFSVSSHAQSGKQMRVIVPFPPGGASDMLSRMVAERLSPLLGHQVSVENRGGAGGNLGAELVYRAEPDGMTLLSSPPHLLTINHLIYKL